MDTKGRTANHRLMARWPDEITPGPVLVIAPHNDDEVLGTGGVIQRHHDCGDPVTVVLMTNGDGQYRGPFRSRHRAVRFGYYRQRETLRALDELGLGTTDVVFLGYPDRGLAQLWNRHWEGSHPYRSPQTGVARSPYDNSLTEGAPYCGEAVVRDLQRLLRDRRPRTIYLPHPNDLHPDHWSAAAFGVYALERLRHEADAEAFEDVHLWTYVVHRGRWPMPRGRMFRAELTPPRALTQLDTDWRQVPLSPTEIRAKHRAILKHRTQVRYMRLYLESFARANELFGHVPRLRLTRRIDVEDSEDRDLVEQLADDERGNALSEPGEPMVSYLDPRHRSLVRNLQRYNDIRALHLSIDGDQLLSVEVECSGRLHPHNQVLIHLKTIDGHRDMPTSWRFLRTSRGLTLNGQPVDDPSVAPSTGMRTFRVRVPLERIGPPTAFLVGAELARRGTTFAKSAYRLVELTHVPVDAET